MSKAIGKRPEPYPKTRFELSKDEFLKLHDALIQKMEREHGLESEGNQSAQYYGMGDYAPSRGSSATTVASIMANHPRIKQFLTTLQNANESVAKVNFGDYLYKKMNEFRRNNEKVNVEFVGKKYVYGYAIFLGYSNLEEFFEKQFDTTHKSNRSSQTGKGEWTYYIGAYFSVKSFGVRTFVLGINFEKPVKSNRFPAREFGFHKLGDIESQNESAAKGMNSEYDGFATIVDKRWLHVNLEGTGINNPFTLLGVVPDNMVNVKKQRLIRGILLSISIRHYPVSAEVILIKTTEEYASNAVNLFEKLSPALLEPSLKREESDIIKMYIMLQRRNFYTNADIIEDIGNLKAKGSLLEDFTYLKGVYRIWNFAMRRGHVIQSIMVIDPDQFNAKLFPYIKKEIAIKNKKLAEQQIVYNISRIRQNKLCLIAYGEPGMSVSSYAIFDLETEAVKKYYEGCFISTGYDTRGIIGGYMVVQKVSNLDGQYLKLLQLRKDTPEAAATYARENNLEHLLDLEPMEMSGKELEAYVTKHQLEPLYKGLKEIWRKKLWKQRKKYGDDYPYTPSVIQAPNLIYILKRPLECRVDYNEGQIGIAHDLLNIQVMHTDRREAEAAFNLAFHNTYQEFESSGQGNPLTLWVDKIFNLRE